MSMRIAALSVVLLIGCGGGTIRPPRFATLNVEATPPDNSQASLEGDTIQIKGKVQFEVGSARIVPDSFVILDEVAQIMHENANIAVMRVEGHTDSSGSKSANTRLSRSRARAVKRYLTEQAGISGDRVVAKGLGPDNPIADNDSPEGREKNRRVEFKVERRATDGATQ